MLLSHQIKLFHHQHATPQIVTSVLINTMALISAHPTKLLHHHSQHHQTVTSALTNTMALLRQTPSSCCILPNSFTSAHENHGTGLTHPIKLLHHPKTSLSVLANTMALLLHTPSSCCITTKQLHQRSRKPWYCYQYTPSSCCFTMALISAHPTKLLHHHSQHHQTVTSALTNTMALLRQTPSSCCILPNSFTSAHENHGTAINTPHHVVASSLQPPDKQQLTEDRGDKV